MGDIRLPYRFTTTTPNAPPSPCSPKNTKKSASPKKFFRFLASPASPSSEKPSNTNNGIHRLSSSSSSASSCFYTPRTTASTTLEASFSKKLDFSDDDGDDDEENIGDGAAIESNKTKALSLWEKKMQFFNSLNSVLSMKGRKMIAAMKKKFLIISKENENKNKSCDHHQVWYQKEVKGIRCKPMSDASFRVTGKMPAVMQSPAPVVVVVVED